MRVGINIPNTSDIRLILIIDTDDQVMGIQQENADPEADDDFIMLNQEMALNLFEVLQHFISENGDFTVPADFKIVGEQNYVQ